MFIHREMFYSILNNWQKKFNNCYGPMKLSSDISERKGLYYISKVLICFDFSFDITNTYESMPSKEYELIQFYHLA